MVSVLLAVASILTKAVCRCRAVCGVGVRGEGKAGIDGDRGTGGGSHVLVYGQGQLWRNVECGMH